MTTEEQTIVNLFKSTFGSIADVEKFDEDFVKKLRQGMAEISTMLLNFAVMKTEHSVEFITAVAETIPQPYKSGMVNGFLQEFSNFLEFQAKLGTGDLMGMINSILGSAIHTH